jgi:hypothetical protein
VGMTDEERRRLDELADELTRDDPHLGRALSVGSFPRMRLWSPGVVVFLAVVSMPLVVLGVGLVQPLVFTAGCASLAAAVWIGVAGGLRRRRSRR